MEHWSWRDEGKKISGKVTTIGMFDSGVGGLTVYLELKKRCPSIHVIYYADTLRQPYGPRPQEAIAEFSAQILRFLQSQGAELVVVACGTATCAVFDSRLNEHPSFSATPILGTIGPSIEAALSHGPRVGVMATEGTCSANAYSRLLPPSSSLVQVACPGFSSIAEANAASDPRTRSAAREAMAPFRRSVDSIIYGCTHYPLLAPAIEAALRDFPGPAVALVDPAAPLVASLLPLLEPCAGPATTRFCASGDPSLFAERASGILGYDVSGQCELVTLT